MVASVLRIKFQEITFAKTVETAAVVEQARKDVCIIVGKDLSVNAKADAHNSSILVSISGTFFVVAACKQGIAGSAETAGLSGVWWFTLSSELSILESGVSPVWSDWPCAEGLSKLGTIIG